MLHFRGEANPSAALGPDLAPLSPPSEGGVFCREILNLPAGPHTVRMQVLLPDAAPDQSLEITAQAPDGAVLARVRLEPDVPDRLARADALTLCFHLAQPTAVTLQGVASSHAALTYLRYGTQASVVSHAGHEALFHFRPEPDVGFKVPLSVIFGTTAVCNANCFHCPTNKAYSRTQAKGFMAQDLFESIVEQLAEIGFTGGVMFGLFGEPLQDPLILQRMRVVKRLLPHSSIVPSTNAAVYNPDKHREALDMADDVSIHIEGVSPEVYNGSMRPLKTGRTFPLAERMIDDRGGKLIHVVTPVHRRNIHESAQLRQAWEERKGIGPTHFTPLMNRAGQGKAFDDVALAPQATYCGPEILDHLIVDWDGMVLMCCQDFHRRTLIGDLTKQTLREVLTGAERARLIRTLNAKCWNSIETCAGCKNDRPETIDALVTEHLKEADARRRFLPGEFHAKGPMARETEVITVDARTPLVQRLRGQDVKAAAVIYGPYKPLYPGRYRFHFDLSDLRADFRGYVRLEVVAHGETLAERRLEPFWPGRPDLVLDAEVPASTPMEFRIIAKGAALVFRGVQATRLDS